MKQIIYIGEMLWKPSLGIYKQWIYYSDGSVEETEVPKGPIVIPKELWEL